MFSTAFSQAKHLQKLIFNDADKPDLKPVVRATLVRAFVELEECKRKLRMKPLPKAIDVSKPKQKAPRRTGLVASSTQPVVEPNQADLPTTPQEHNTQ